MKEKIEIFKLALRPFNNFFKEYQEQYIQNFIQMIQKEKESFSPLIDQKLLRTLALTLYTNIYLLQTDSTEKLKEIVDEAADNGLDFKTALKYADIKLTRDFIDYLLDNTQYNYLAIKSLSDLISSFHASIDKYYALYHQQHQNRNRNGAQDNEKEHQLIITLLQKFYKNGHPINLIAYYQEVPIICKNVPLQFVSNKSAFLDISECQYDVFKENEKVYIKTSALPKAIEANIVQLEPFKKILVDSFRLVDLPMEKRKYIRVKPKDPIAVEVLTSLGETSGAILDISVGGVRIHTNEPDKFIPGSEATLIFILEKRPVTAKAIVRFVDSKNSEIGMEFVESQEVEDIVSKYILKRQFEIIRRIKI